MLVPICKTPHATTRPFTVWHAWPRAMQIGHDRSAGIALRRCCKRTTPQPAVAEATPLPDECYKVPIQKRDFPIDTILGWKQKKRLNLKPTYQRDFVWKEPKSSRLIETIFLQLPIQEMWLHEQERNHYEVIDGQQRLTTVAAFEQGEFGDGTPFKLQKLEILEDLNGKTYQDLLNENSPFIDSFLTFALCLRIVENSADPAGVFEVYQRINTGAENLNAQHIRRAAYRGPYIDLLHQLAKTHMGALPKGNTSFTKEQDRELIVRFFAMHNSLNKFKPPLSRFLNNEMQEHRYMDTDTIQDYTKLFSRTIKLATRVFGKDVFRKWDSNTDKFVGGAVDTSLWDMVMLTLVDYSSADLQDFADGLQVELKQLKSRMQAEAAPARVTAEKVKARKKDFPNLIDASRGSTSHHASQSRSFSPSVKAKLYAESQTCCYCSNKILREEDAEVDHIVPFSKGGNTEDTNAQLLHTHCNRKKGNELHATPLPTEGITDLSH